jgi:putative selenate reductase molybdopterin-binding subunit
VSGVIGSGRPLIETRERVEGTLRYTSDLVFEGGLHAALVVSPYHHAKIRSIDARAAERSPGVVAVLTGADVPRRPVAPMPVVVAGEHVAERILLGDEVCFLGEAVAAVAAETRDQAEEAADRIRIDWDVLDGVFSPDDALRPDAPEVRTGHPNLVGAPGMPVVYERGDVDDAFARAEHVFEGRYSTSTVAAGALEPYGCTVVPDDDGGITVHKGTPAAFEVRQTLSAFLGLPTELVRVVTPPTGGSFGSRTEELEFLCALLALEAGRPVSLTMRRHEGRPAGRVRHGAVFELRSAVSADGRLLGRTMRAIYDCGGYPDLGRYVVLRAMRPLVLYGAEAIRFEGLLVRTNKPVAAATRGFGNPQATFAVESHNGEIARALGLDPIDFRLRNGVRSGDVNWSVGKASAAGVFQPRGWTISSCGLQDCLRLVGERLQRWRDDAPELPPHLRRGVGVASMMHTTGKGRNDHSTARVTLREHGAATIESGASDQGGTGLTTTLAMVVAEVLGLTVEAVEVRSGDTRFGLPDSGAHASSRTYVAGSAARLAAESVRAARDAGEALPITREERFAPDSNAPPFAACGAEVEVDLQTGQVRVLRMVSANDVGRALNPHACVGQVQGAVAQGVGFALAERWPMIEGVPWEMARLVDERMPRAPDVPPLEVLLVEPGEQTGPFGAKGVGEAGIIAVAPAIANAVADAIGVQVRDLPMEPERVWRALREADAG